MLAEGWHHFWVDREWLSLSPRHQRNQSGHVLVSNQWGKDLCQLSLEVGVELGLDVEAVHIGKYWDDTTQGMKVLNQSLGNKFLWGKFSREAYLYPVKLVDERVISNITQLVGPLAESNSNGSLGKADDLGKYKNIFLTWRASWDPHTTAHWTACRHTYTQRSTSKKAGLRVGTELAGIISPARRRLVCMSRGDGSTSGRWHPLTVTRKRSCSPRGSC